MDLLTDPEMPHWLKLLVWCAVGMAAMTYIVRGLRDSGALKLIAGEMKNNGGSTLKDKIEKAVRLAEQAADGASQSRIEARRATDEGRRAKEISIETDGKVDWLISHLIGRVPSPEEIKRALQAGHGKNQ